MRIVILTGSISRSAGGLYFSVRALAKRLAAMPNVSVEVWAIAGKDDEDYLEAWAPLKLRLFAKTLPGRYGLSLSMLIAMSRSNFDLVHLNGLWSFPSIAARLAALRGTPLVVSPRGMLDPWILARHNILKKIYYLLIERPMLRGARTINALSDSERQAVLRLTLGVSCVQIPNGVDLYSGDRSEKPAAGPKTLIFIGRYDDKKGLLEFMHTWQKLDANIKTSWRVVTYGWGNTSYERMVKKLIVDLGLQGSWSMQGPVFGEDKSLALRAAGAFVLPTKGEGLPMAVLEAWAYGLPVLTTKQANLPEGFKRGAAFDLGERSEWEENAFLFLNARDQELFDMGQAGRQLVEENFSWDGVASQYYSLFANVCASGSNASRKDI